MNFPDKSAQKAENAIRKGSDFSLLGYGSQKFAQTSGRSNSEGGKLTV